MKKIAKFALLFLTVCLASCSSDSTSSNKNTATNYAHFYMRYLQSENRLEANANFSHGDSLQSAQPIKMENGVFFHGANMNERDLGKMGIRYNATRDGAFSKQYTFKYNDPNHGQMIHDFHINALHDFSINSIENLSENSFSKSHPLALRWEGEPLEKEEHLVFLFNMKETEGNGFVTFDINQSTQKSELIIPPQKLKNLKPGKAELYLVRKKVLEKAQENYEIFTEMEFYTRVIDVTILP